MGSFGGESVLVLQLIEAGNSLLNPPPSTDGLLNLLDEIETLLSNVEQDPPMSMQDAMLPSMKALISSDLLRHPDSDVRVSVVLCLTEITRITAPDAPYDDELMKEIFQLTVEAFGKLSDMSSRSYRKAELVLDTVSKVRSCLLMLDLECDALILEMFQCFLKIISSNHSQVVVLAIETIMSMVIDESEEVSTDLLDMLLASVRKENENVLPVSWRLVERVLSGCASKLKPYIVEALKSAGNSLDMYSPVVSSICHSGSSISEEHNTVNAKENERDEKRSVRPAAPRGPLKGTSDWGQLSDTIHTKDSSKQCVSGGTRPTDKSDNLKNGGSPSSAKHCSILGNSKGTDAGTESEAVPKKRGRKPNSLMNPEEGYDHSWISRERDSFKTPLSKKLRRKRVRNLSLGEPVPKNAPFLKETPSLSSKIGQTSQTVVISLPSLGDSLRGPRKRSRPKSEAMCRDVNSLSLSTVKKEVSSIRVKKEGLPSLHVATKTGSPDKEYLMTTSQESSGKSKDGREAAKSGKKAKKTATKEPVTEAKTVKTSGKGSVVRSDAKKQKLKDATLDQHIPGSSKSTKITSKVKTRPLAKGSEETPKSNLTRKRSARKEGDPEMPRLGEELVGKRIKVWWPLDKTFYEGVVDLYDNIRKRHRVLYSDGDMEVLNLKKQRWELIKDETSDKLKYLQDQANDLPESSTLSDILQTQKVNRSKKTSVTGKTASSSKKRSSTRTSKKKAVQKGFNEQVKRVEDGVVRKTMCTLKAETEEPGTKEGQNLNSLKELNAKPEGPEVGTNKKQNVTPGARGKKEEDCSENQEPKTKEGENQKSQEESNAGPGREKDVTVPNESDTAATPEEKTPVCDIDRSIGVSETGQQEPETKGEDSKYMKEPNAEPGRRKIDTGLMPNEIKAMPEEKKREDDAERCASMSGNGGQEPEPKEGDEPKSMKEPNAEPGEPEVDSSLE